MGKRIKSEKKGRGEESKFIEEYTPLYVVLPYIKGVTERITRTLQREKIRVSFQPTRTLQQEFPKPKDKLVRH